jgi:D-glycerate 3-kinase
VSPKCVVWRGRTQAAFAARARPLSGALERYNTLLILSLISRLTKTTTHSFPPHSHIQHHSLSLSLSLIHTDYVATSPILAACGLDRAAVASAAAEWGRLGALLAARLGLTDAKADPPAPAPPSSLPPAASSRIYRYYLPIFFWVRAQVDAHKKQGGASGGPLVLGINAPQGCGKTTLVTELEALAAATGLAAATVSIDDFYLTRAGQAALAAAHRGNPLLELRGNAGSHDLELGSATLAALRAAGPGDSVPLPRYDKAAHGGLGDRAPVEAWPVVSGPLDLVLLEGWMLGFAPVGAAAAAAASPHLPAVDAALGAYEAAWDAIVGAWLVIAAPSAQCVYAWRAEAEEALRASGRGGMSPAAVADFCDRYMPAYAAYGPGLLEKGPTSGTRGKVLVVGVRADRSLADDQPAPPACA